jgi:hypothetical protein
MHQRCRRLIEDLGFSPWRKSDFTKKAFSKVIAMYNQ